MRKVFNGEDELNKRREHCGEHRSLCFNSDCWVEKVAAGASALSAFVHLFVHLCVCVFVL